MNINAKSDNSTNAKGKTNRLALSFGHTRPFHIPGAHADDSDSNALLQHTVLCSHLFMNGSSLNSQSNWKTE